MKNDNVRELSKHACGTDISDDLECSTAGGIGVLLSCIIDNRERIKNGPCQTFIQRLEWVAFSDFRIIAHFTTDCEKDIKKAECGRLHAEKVCGYYLILCQMWSCGL
jgi:Golgi apparatus protein 1